MTGSGQKRRLGIEAAKVNDRPRQGWGTKSRPARKALVGGSEWSGGFAGKRAMWNPDPWILRPQSSARVRVELWGRDRLDSENLEIISKCLPKERLQPLECRRGEGERVFLEDARLSIQVLYFEEQLSEAFVSRCLQRSTKSQRRTR